MPLGSAIAFRCSPVSSMDVAGRAGRNAGAAGFACGLRCSDTRNDRAGVIADCGDPPSLHGRPNSAPRFRLVKPRRPDRRQ